MDYQNNPVAPATGTSRKKMGIWFVVGPFVALVVILILYAVLSAATTDSTGGSLAKVLLGLLGVLVVMAMMVCVPIGIAMLVSGPKVSEMEQLKYGGFWLRLVAYLIDGAVVSFSLLVISAILMALVPQDKEIALFPLWILIIIVAGWLYFILMESSAKQATLGKMALGLKVTDMNGQRITFLRALARYFCKMISAIILYIGFLMAAFTPKKQALHDMIAGTLVVKK